MTLLYEIETMKMEDGLVLNFRDFLVKRIEFTKVHAASFRGSTLSNVQNNATNDDDGEDEREWKLYVYT